MTLAQTICLLIFVLTYLAIILFHRYKFIIAWIGYLIYGFGAMGIGDVKLAAMIGAFVGLKLVIPALFIGFVAGGVFSIILMIMRVAGLRSLIPFGPYLCIGGLAALMYGPNIIFWYVGYLR